MKDMSKIFFIYNGYTIKSLRSITPEFPNEFEQSEPDVYGEHENLYIPDKRLKFTLVVPVGEVDELTLDTFRAGKVEAPGAFIDKRGSNVNTVAFNKAVIQSKTKTGDRTTDTAEYVIIASRLNDTTIKG